MKNDELIVIPECLFGRIEIVTTRRLEGNVLILGGYSIHYDQHGREVLRTEDRENVRCIFPEPEQRKWWQFWL